MDSELYEMLASIRDELRKLNARLDQPVPIDHVRFAGEQIVRLNQVVMPPRPNP